MPESHPEVTSSWQLGQEGESQPHFFLTLLQKVPLSSCLARAVVDPNPSREVQAEASRRCRVTQAALGRLSAWPIRPKKGNSPEWIIALWDLQR